jgi:hypothetical protein
MVLTRGFEGLHRAKLATPIKKALAKCMGDTTPPSLPPA